MANERTISRRSFLTGAVLSAAAVAAAPAATALAAEGAEGKAASENPSWLGEAPEIAESDITSERSCDLLIVGAGNGGMMAASTAADLGLDFIIAEKGIKMARARGWFGAVNTKYYTDQGITVDVSRLRGEIIRYSQGYCNMQVVNTWFNESAEMFDYLDPLLKAAGMKPRPCEFDLRGMGGTDFYCPPIEHTYSSGSNGESRNDVFLAHIQELGYDIDYSHDLVRLTQDDSGKVTGAIFKTPDGYERIVANNVLLTTGGYAANPEMLDALEPNVARSCTASAWWPCNTGAGIKAAMWAGAHKDEKGAVMIFDRGIVPPGTKAGWTEESVKKGRPQLPSSGQFNTGTQPFLKVNVRGERFTNESADYDYLPNAATNQPNGVYCIIWDADIKQDVDTFHTLGCSAGTRDMFDQYNGPGGVYEMEIENGRLFKCDTLEELAEKLQLPVDTFMATVERYNQLCADGYDADFGKEPYRMTPLDHPPYYGATIGGCLLTTLSGLSIDKDMRVLDRDCNPIEGLFAAGDCSGGVFANNYPDQLHGMAVGRTMTFARHAVRYIAGDL